MEHGPATTSRRRSLPPRISQISWRVWWTVAEAVSVVGISSSKKTGGSTTLVHFMRRSSMGWNMVVYVGSVTQSGNDKRRTAISLMRSGVFRTKRSGGRSEEHTSELQSLRHLVCRLLLEKKMIVPEVALVRSVAAARRGVGGSAARVRPRVLARRPLCLTLDRAVLIVPFYFF